MTWDVPFFDLNFGDDEQAAITEVIKSNWLTSGPRIEEFENKFSNKHGDGYLTVSVSSCTAALHLALLALGIGPGDEVLLPSLTFVATANAVRYVGATPVFVDITSEEVWNISPIDSLKKIGPKTKALIVVHYAGYPCEMELISKIAKKHNLFLIEDCAHAPFANINNRMVGTFGDVGCFSFFSNKNITCGEGGALLTADRKIAERVRTLRSHGISSSTYQRFKSHSNGYDVTDLGFNYRLDEIRAAILLVQLKKINLFNSTRGQLANTYRKILNERIPEIRIPFADAKGVSAHHIFPVLLPKWIKRDMVMQEMADMGIQCSIHYRPIHTFTFYEGIVVDVPYTERIQESILTLPFYATISSEQINKVVNSLRAAIAKQSINNES